MKTLSVSELKAKLSAQLRYVRSGQRVIVTDRGTPVAMLVPFPEAGNDVLTRLESGGQLHRAESKLPASFWRAERPEDREASVRGAVTSEREAGW